VRLAKRALDVAAASIGLAVTLPFYPLIGAAIYIDSPGPLFYRQRRAGELIGPETRGGGNGHGTGSAISGFRFREFHMLKFRTMRPDAERLTGAIIAKEGDPRVTRVGRFLRKTRLDELPQFWNVLVGDMSVVGPRPPQPSEVTAYDGTVFRRLYIKPGSTGLWQISGRSDLPWEETVRLDLRYVENWSLALDALILWKTGRAVLSQTGAY
jgi:lipopolysaccharide/colanic/teichoic acid biosynthesis glycosyltransferase